MDQVTPAAYNPHLQRVLKSFQTAAEASLSGPSRYMAVWGNHDPATAHESVKSVQDLNEFRKTLLSNALSKKSPSQPVGNDKVTCQAAGGTVDSNQVYFPTGGYSVPPHMGPLLLPMDNSHSEKSETILEGDTISCFEVGGEKRLCLPQIFNKVLQKFSLQQINTICDDLHIFCSRCNPPQLDLLKMTGVLPPSAPSCGLITKTDAERLCNALLHNSPEKTKDPPSPNSFKVYHECFGKCKGVFTPELYVDANAKCIECCDCQGMFTPQKFVCHSHKALENRTCHWGFDSAHWRAYLLLAKDQDSRDNMQRALDDMKDRYDFAAGYKKRRESSNHRKECDSKRARYDDSSKALDVTSAWNGEFGRGMSAFRPWSPSVINLIKEGKIPAPSVTRDGMGLLPSYLQKGPPVLLNPERVVPFNDTKRYDRHFAPNVSLAPPPPSNDDDKCDTPIKLEYESPCRVDTRLLSSTSNYSFSSSSMSALSSPSPVKVERHQELDMSSSDESSFKSESVPTTPRDDHRSLSEVSVPTEADLKVDREQLLGLVQGMLESRSDITDSDRNCLLEQVAELWSRQEDRIRALAQGRRLLVQEVELLRVSKREKIQEISESRLALRKEVEHLHSDLDFRCQQTASDKQRLKQDIEYLKATKNQDLARVKSKYQEQIETLHSRLEHYEKLNANMAAQITQLQKQLNTLQEDSEESMAVDTMKSSSVLNGIKCNSNHSNNDIDMTEHSTSHNSKRKISKNEDKYADRKISDVGDNT